MPYKPARYCKHPRCLNKTYDRSGYCEQHRLEHHRLIDSNRGTANERGYGRRWQKASRAYLISHPLCAICYRRGIITPATLVDHTIPHHGDYNLFWDRSNWQSLCAHCHNVKTAREDGGFGNEIKTDVDRGVYPLQSLQP
jgi:5-methylcytosine-specific restriction enzyme A